MASYVDILFSEDINIDEFLKWMSGAPASDIYKSTQRELCCSRYEFALCFLNYLRDHTSRILSNEGGKSSCKTVHLSSNQLTLHIPANDKPSQCATNFQPEEVCNNSKKHIPFTETKTSRRSVCSPDKSFGDSTSDERSPCHTKTKVHNPRRNSFDSPIIPYSSHLSFSNSKRGSPKQSPCFESTPIKSHNDSLSEKSHNKSPRENWTPKNSQTTTLWDYVSKDNSLGARKKNGSDSGCKDEKTQDKRGGTKVNSKQKRQRRINPTRVTKNVDCCESEGVNSVLTTEQPFGIPQEIPSQAGAFSSRTKEQDEFNSSSFAEERALMKEERIRMQSLEHDSSTSSPPKTSCVVRSLLAEPQLDIVTSRKQLDTLANVFSVLLSNNLVPNILSELCFLCNLLMIKVSCDSQTLEHSSDEEAVQNDGYFNTVHNCAYFAATVLAKQSSLLQLLDKNTRRIIAENSRLSRFAPALSVQVLKEVSSSRREVPNFQNPTLSSTLTSFQTDVDNRKNFPTDRAFHMFCRQRDEFCEALRAWESGRSMPGWSFSVVLGPRIRSILSPAHSTPEPTNFIHLARFFRAQLLANCGNIGVAGVEVSSGPAEVVPIALRDADPNKLQRLQRRLVWPSRSRGGCCPVSTFPGAQEFFRDFIVYGANHVFNEHLKDGLVSDLMKLNDSQFNASELEEQENKVDDDTRNEYIRCVLNMQLLAKFLGFLVFLPYQSDARLPDNILLSQCAIRNKVMPLLDLIGLLRRAWKLRCLSITIPWMVVFLSMIDRVSSSIEYYKENFFPYLVATYRGLATYQPYGGKGKPTISHTLFLVKLCLGWLFEQPNFPQEAVFADKADALAIDEPFYIGASNGEGLLQPKGPDDLDLIDDFAVHIICPFVSEIRMIMTDCFSGRTGSGTNVVRHITPVSAPDRMPALSSTRLVEVKLEENFFCNQPASLRRTVDFVSERIASTCVRHICNKLLPKALKKGLVRIRNSTITKLQDNEADKSPHEAEPAEKFEVTMAREIREFSSEEWLALKKDCIEYADKECERRAWDAIPPLLPHAYGDDVSKAVRLMSMQVTCREARQKVRRWINSHTSAALFAKEYEAEVVKLVASTQKPNDMKKSVEEIDNLLTSKESVSQNMSAGPSAAQIISSLRELILDMLNPEQRHSVELRMIQEVIENSTISIQSANNFTPPSMKTIFSLTVDLAIFIVAYGIKMDEDASKWNWDMFIPLWSKLATLTDESFMRILSPRNLYLLSLVEDQPQRGKSGWPSRLSSLLTALLSAKLLSPKQLEEQSLIVLHTAWPQEFLAKYSECIQGVTDHPEVSEWTYDDDQGVVSSALLMEWLAESCATMEMLE